MGNSPLIIVMTRNWTEFFPVLVLWTFALNHVASTTCAEESTFFLAKGGSTLRPPYIREVKLGSVVECSAACGRDVDCSGYSYLPDESGTCRTVSVTTNSTVANKTGCQVWFKIGRNGESGNPAVAIHRDGNTYVLFNQWDTSLAAARSVCSSKGGRLAPIASMERLAFFSAMLLIGDADATAVVNAGMWDDDNDGIFKDQRGNQPVDGLELAWNAGNRSTSDRPCLTVVFRGGNARPFYNKTACTNKHPWICEFARSDEYKERGCWMEPPAPHGARTTPPSLPATPAKTGDTVNYTCSEGERFVNGNKSPTAVCGPDGYWNVSSPFYPCTGGPNFMLGSESASADHRNRTCYKVDKNVRVSLSKASQYCGSMGGTVLSLSAATKPIFEALPRDPVTNEHYRYLFSGFVNYTNVDPSGNPRDAEGNAMDVASLLDEPADGDDKLYEYYLVVDRRSTGPNSSFWSMYDIQGATTYPRVICKFVGC